MSWMHSQMWLEYAGHAGQVVRDELDAQSNAVSGAY